MKENEQLTAKAYKYAKNKGKVNEGVIEAYKDGYERGQSEERSKPLAYHLDNILGRFRDKQTIEHELGMSDARRGLNDQEKEEATKHEDIKKFIDELLD